LPALNPSNFDGEKDFVAIAIAYAERAIADKVHYGRWVRLAAKRFLKDLKRAGQERGPFYFDPDEANRPCRFTEMLQHVEGKWETPTILMHPSHIFFVVNLFGFRQYGTGKRRFTVALFCVARKNAKSTLAAAIMDYCLCFEEEEGAQLISAATTGSQARIVFNVAKRMIEKDEELQQDFGLEMYSRAITREETGSSFKPINSKASTQDGLNPSHVSLDEIHAHKTHDLINVIRSAAGARECPLWLYTTTEGFESPGPWPEERAFAENILKGAVDADHYLAVIYAIDDKDDDFDEERWIKANPLMDVNPLLLKKNRELAIEAKNKPGSLAEFRIKRLNRRSSSATGWTNLTRWRKCEGKFLLDHMVGAKCWASFDLASTTDMAAWRILWFLEGVYYTWGRYWVPADAVKQRTERKSVNYQGWVDAGLVTLCSGATNDFDQIRGDVVGDIRRFSPSIIAYDPWNATQFVNDLQGDGVDVATAEDPRGLMQFIQGPKSFSPAMRLCETAYLNGNLRTGADPVLTWHMANVVPSYDSNMNVRPNKLKSPDKIDGAVALFMCFGCAAMVVDESDPFAQMVVG
jgi:phage terminase large subunit-like protein